MRQTYIHILLELDKKTYGTMVDRIVISNSFKYIALSHHSCQVQKDPHSSIIVVVPQMFHIVW